MHPLLNGLSPRLAFLRKQVLPAFMISRRFGRRLSPVQDNTSAIRRNDILLFCTLRNERQRIPFFLDYYRSLGVAHFIFVDNGSDDGFQKCIAEMSDVSVWSTNDSYRAAGAGIGWMNHLLARIGAGHWCITVDCDELLVYPHSETRNLAELTDYLSVQGFAHLPCLMVDMYSDGGADRAPSIANIDPRSVCLYFDADGYRFQPSDYWTGYYIQGGLRERIYFSDNPSGSPALNKTPLVKWRKGYFYLSSTHSLFPRRLNRWHAGGASPRVTGALLHFKFVDTLKAKIAEELSRSQRDNQGAEYRAYARQADYDKNWICERSRRFDSSKSLVESGLMTVGEWF